MNTAPNLEKVQVGERAPVSSVAERLEWLLAGRSPWKWGERVLLSTGAISRMQKGGLPDPEKLIPAMRIENLSLNWLVDGQGAPFLVAMPASDAEAAEWITTQMRDESTEVLVVFCADGFTPVLHTQVSAELPNGEAYTYRAATVIGGRLGAQTTQAIRGQAEWLLTHLQAVEVSEETWRDIVTGYAGSYALFGDDNQGGLLAKSWPCITDKLPRAIADQAGGYQQAETSTWLSEESREALALFSKLGTADRAAALRMLRGLSEPRL